MTTTVAAIIVLLLLSFALLAVQQIIQKQSSALRVTGHQLFANGTGLAYFDDGTTQRFKHRITPAAGYYYDNSTIFYTGEIPGVSSAASIFCSYSKVAVNSSSSSSDNIVHNVTLIRGADLIENKSKAIEPSPIIKIKMGDTIKWSNIDYTIHSLQSLPIQIAAGGTSGIAELPNGENFSVVLSVGSPIYCTFTEPGGFHYADSDTPGIKGVVIVEE